MTRRIIFVISIVLFAATVPARAADESLAAARDLYAAAAYEDALVMLSHLQGADLPPADRRGVQQYRAFCLLALGRTSDAEHAIEAVVSAEPSYQPSDAEVSPRLRTAFSDVRKRMLPGIIQDQYSRAKAAFDQKNYSVASTGFKEMLSTLGDPAVGPLANQPPLSDLKTLASGFYELAAASVPAPPKPLPAAAPAVAMAPPSAPAPAAPHVYGQQDAEVVPPVPVRQALPEYDRSLGRPLGAAVLEVVVDETGAVQLAVLRGSVQPRYDQVALEAARGWRYRPAMRNGIPVKYTKTIKVEVKF